MKTKPTKAARRNPFVVVMFKHHSEGKTSIKDRRTPRGGTKNNQRDYREEKY